ncbi:MAG: dephospho-CoA kinase [Pirellulales bacterium]|nr:dephospho-CoA kinase [Pirellulales bacterium]
MPLLTIGIIGPIAGGKSTVAARLAELGATVVHADQLGHQVLREREVEQKARARWGGDIFGSDGRIDRKRLAEIVFSKDAAGREELEYLENLTHPGIRRRLDETIRGLETSGVQAVVIDAALLLEAGWDEFCAKIIYVGAPDTVVLERAKERGWTAEEYAARAAAQMPLDRKRARADFVIDNSGSPEELQAEVDRVWRSLRA